MQVFLYIYKLSYCTALALLFLDIYMLFVWVSRAFFVADTCSDVCGYFEGKSSYDLKPLIIF